MNYDVSSDMDRRQFIKIGIVAGAGVLAVSALPVAIDAILANSPSFTPAADLSRDALMPLQDDVVQVTNGGGAVPLTVREITTATPYRGHEGGAIVGDTFSIIFEGPSSSSLAQDSYTMNHGRLGRFPIFITPVDQPLGTTHRYEAVFNRLR
jgi:hypothetical protein